jgi:hypothetical protein
MGCTIRQNRRRQTGFLAERLQQGVLVHRQQGGLGGEELIAQKSLGQGHFAVIRRPQRPVLRRHRRVWGKACGQHTSAQMQGMTA